MKKTYIQPMTDIIPLATMPLLAGSGPSGGDSSAPDIGDYESEREETAPMNIRANLWTDTEPCDF